MESYLDSSDGTNIPHRTQRAAGCCKGKQWLCAVGIARNKIIIEWSQAPVCHMSLLYCTSAAKTRGELISEMAAARLIYGRHWKGATGTQRGRRMLHLETNCRSIEPTQPKSPAGEMESDQLSGSYGFSRLVLGTARRSRPVREKFRILRATIRASDCWHSWTYCLWCRTWHCAVQGQPYSRRQKLSKLKILRHRTRTHS